MKLPLPKFVFIGVRSYDPKALTIFRTMQEATEWQTRQASYGEQETRVHRFDITPGKGETITPDAGCICGTKYSTYGVCLASVHKTFKSIPEVKAMFETHPAYAKHRDKRDARGK